MEITQSDRESTIDAKTADDPVEYHAQLLAITKTKETVIEATKTLRGVNIDVILTKYVFFKHCHGLYPYYD